MSQSLNQVHRDALRLALAYESVTPSRVDALVRGVNRTNLDLRSSSEAKLRSRVAEVLVYLENPNFEEYYRLKTDGFHYRLAPDGYAKKLLARLPDLNQKNPEPQDYARRLWTEVHTHNGTLIVPRVTAICLKSFSVAVAHTNSTSALLNGKVGKGFTVAVQAIDPGFIYCDDATAPAEPIVVEFSFFAKASASDRAGPIHLSLCWIDQDQNWALCRLISDKWLAFETMF